MKVYYDFHIHTCLSPCGDNDMTPNNIVNMAQLKGLDAIAITDHNTFRNARACMNAAEERNLTVIPGMEVETSEEIHVVALFPNIGALENFGNIITHSLPMIKNKPAIFGEQLVMDSEDEIVGFEEQFLITAVSFNIYEVCDMIHKFGGVAIPAHVDKSSYSVISSLGCVPDDLDISCVEVKNKTFLQKTENGYVSDKYNIIHNSDAHYLWDISEKDNFLECENSTIECILHNLNKQKTL